MDVPNDHVLRGQASITRVLLGLLALGFLALVLGAGAALWLQTRNEESAARVQHTLLVDARVGEFAALNERVETGRRGYLLAGQPSFRQIFQNAAAEMPAKVEELARLTADDPVQQQRVARLRRLVEEKQRFQVETVAAVASGRRTAIIQGFERDRGVVLTRAMRQLAAEMSAHERALLQGRVADQRSTLRIFYGVLALVGVLLVLAAGTTLIVMLRYARQLGHSQDQLRALNVHLEDMVDERTRDLLRANQEIQRFAYIVSHDLRSPLVNVMGFTAELETAGKVLRAFLQKVNEAHPDLVTQDVRFAAEEDLPEAIGFIRTSTQKMDRLINAILRLSREGRRTLTPEPLDMDALVQGIIDSLHQRAADAGAEIHADALPAIVGDRVALEQILSNLVENAVKYLKPGRAGVIRVTGRHERDRVIYEVTDNGRGIDPRDHERIFDLFRRSGTQDQPGEGIGLAHVRALVHRLGGVIEVRSELDRGSTFRLSLPPKLNPGDIKDG